MTKQAIYTMFVGLFLNSMVLTATQSQTNFETIRLMDEQEWYLIEVLGCMVPLPNNYVLQTDAEPFRFYELSANDLLSGLGHIMVINDYENEPLSNDIKIDLLEENDGIYYEHMKYIGKDTAYVIHKNTHAVLISHVNKDVQKELAEKMFDYCKSHPVRH